MFAGKMRNAHGTSQTGGYHYSSHQSPVSCSDTLGGTARCPPAPSSNVARLAPETILPERGTKREPTEGRHQEHERQPLGAPAIPSKDGGNDCNGEYDSRTQQHGE